jgi:hypothetical protein
MMSWAKIKNILVRIITRLYWQLGCYSKEDWARQFVCYVIPGKLTQKEICVILAEMEEINNKMTLKLRAFKNHTPSLVSKGHLIEEGDINENSVSDINDIKL